MKCHAGSAMHPPSTAHSDYGDQHAHQCAAEVIEPRQPTSFSRATVT